MPQFPRLGAEVPTCPICDGPCTHEFERSVYVFPDQLTHTDADGEHVDPAEKPNPKPSNKRGKRAHRPSEDRMHRPSEDRS